MTLNNFFLGKDGLYLLEIDTAKVLILKFLFSETIFQIPFYFVSYQLIVVIVEISLQDVVYLCDDPANREITNLRIIRSREVETGSRNEG
jgi:hypothetical protein